MSERVVRWEDDRADVTWDGLVAHPNRVVEVVDSNGEVIDRFRPRNLAGSPLGISPARSLHREG